MIADIKCNGLSVVDWAGQGDGVLAVSARCLGDAGMKDSSEQLSTYHLSAGVSINRHVFVPTDTLLKWNETSRGDKDLRSLCESNLKVPLRRLSFCSLKSGSTTGGWAQTQAQTETLTGAVKAFSPLLVFWKDHNVEMKPCLQSGSWSRPWASSGFTYLFMKAKRGGGGGEQNVMTERKGGPCVYVWKRKGLFVDEKKKTMIKGKRQIRGGEQGKGEGSLKGHHLALQ